MAATENKKAIGWLQYKKARDTAPIDFSPYVFAGDNKNGYFDYETTL